MKKLETSACPFHQQHSSNDTDELAYHSYLKIEELMALCQPVTSKSGEDVFIRFHQGVEIHFAIFKTVLKAFLSQTNKTVTDWEEGLKRLTNTLHSITQTFTILKNCLSAEEFLAFRGDLQPASGFQSAQFREIELMSTNLLCLQANHAKTCPSVSLVQRFCSLYWIADSQTATVETLRGALASNYYHLLDVAEMYEQTNLYSQYMANTSLKNSEFVTKAMDKYQKALVAFKTGHLMMAKQFLPDVPEESWRPYLDMSLSITYFPSL
jgi:Tryptophan 2,3-dioxygenase (vermilion)